ncbi:MAG TPA: dihydrolipoamide acetyltransferase family protein [Candidatus Acidoferrum sp.]|nr:dihydrolipoamide acetyltransferase family protein [Candidatus Acidoferrum sp.]
MIDVTMPQLGESVETGTITRWMKRAGDAVEVDEPIFEVSSDKVTMEVPSLVAGRLGEIVAHEGQEVPVGSVVARIATADEREPVAAVVTSDPPHNGLRRRTGAQAFSPVVRRLAREHAIELSAVRGSAENGRITKRDVLAFIAAAESSALRQAQRNEGGLRQAQPDTRGGFEPLSPIRRTIASRLAAAQKTAVNVFSVVELDMERVAEERKRRKLTYLPFIARAVVDALRAYPALNASISDDGSAVARHDAVHLGIAVDLDEQGLVVPVLRDAQGLTVDGIATAIARLADAARAGSLPADGYTGSTFSITNNGAFGALMTAPVINAPNVAVVSTDAVEERAVVIDHMIAIRRRMYFCMTWDHRAFDGSTAARFLARVKHNLETWDWSTQ